MSHVAVKIGKFEPYKHNISIECNDLKCYGYYECYDYNFFLIKSVETSLKTKSNNNPSAGSMNM